MRQTWDKESLRYLTRPDDAISMARLLIIPFVAETPHRRETSGCGDWCLLTKGEWSYLTRWLSSGFKTQSQQIISTAIIRNKFASGSWHFHEQTDVCWQHPPHADFLWGHTYPSWGRRTRALGRSSTEELTIVSRKSPSGLATSIFLKPESTQ